MKEILLQIKKYNFWENKDIDLGFIRDSYLQKILSYSTSNLIKVLVGQRRVGKSYILRQILSNLISQGLPRKNTLYINREYTDFGFIKNSDDLEFLFSEYKKHFKPKGKIAIFIDEIQNIENWEKFVNSHSQDFTEKCDIYISGSNSKMLSGELATLLSGRYVEFEIFPFSFEEFTKVNSLAADKNSYVKYLSSGGMPELFILPNDESRKNYISALKDTVFLRDIIQRYKIKDPNLLEDLFTYIVNNASSLLSANSIVKYYKGKGKTTTYDTISAYLEYMTDSFVIHKVDRYDIRGKETLAGNCKYYVNDLSFHNFLYSGFGYGIGYQLENILYLELRRMGFEVYIGTSRDKEIDFVAKKNDRVVYVQSCYLLADESTITREYSPLESVKDNYEKYVVSLDDVKMPNKDGIQHLQAWEFSQLQ